MIGNFAYQGSFRASLFIIVKCILYLSIIYTNSAASQNQQSAINTAHHLELEKSLTWMSLLHFSQHKPHIIEPQFLLTSSHFSLSSELHATITAFHSQDKEKYLCRFPARYFWLKQFVTLPELSFDLCKDLIVFEQKAPADKISVIYVSENIAQPSSMMGHLFLKISGLNNQADHVEHAISFYTDAKTFNIPKLMYDSMVKGKQGFFALSPYAEKIYTHTHNEQRNLWEFELALTDQQRRLIQLHLYELKQTEFTYFFQNYNCATVVSFIVSLAIPELREPEGIWVTPLDIAKKIHNTKSIHTKTVSPSERWNLRMLQAQLPSHVTHAIKTSIESGNIALPQAASETEQFLSINMARSFNNYRFQKNIVDAPEWKLLAEKIDVLEPPNTQHLIDLSEYKNPLNTPPDSQVWLGLAHQKENWYVRTGIFPASHSLEDDNRQYFGETSLHLAAFSLLTHLESGNTRLEKFELYAVESIIPYDKFTGGVSGKFSIGLEPVYNQQLSSQQQTFIKGALGYTYELTPDIDFYGLAGVGIGHAGSKNYLYASPEIGLVVREMFDMKSIFSFVQHYGQLDRSNPQNEFNFTQAIYLNKTHAIFFHAKKIVTKEEKLNTYDITFKHYF